MIDPQSAALFTAAALALAISPGPGNFYVAARTLAGGRADGVASSLATGLGGLVHVVAGSIGVSALLLASATLFAVLKWVGAAYLVWLGIRTIRSARADSLPGAEHLGPTGARGAFREGVLVEALNPKTAAFFLAFIPQFVDPEAGSVAAQFAVLGLISVALNTIADLGVALVAARIRAAMTSRPTLIRRLRQGSGAMMVTLGLGLLFARRPMPG